MNPILFLDVDGVLNVPKPDDSEPISTPGGPVWVPDGTKERVSLLREAFEVVWATAWLGRASETWHPLLGVEDERWDHVIYRDFKLIEVVRYACGRPWAFVDDDADWELRGLGWDRDRHCAGNLVLNVDHTIGLTDEHVEQLLDFAREAC